MPVFLLAAIVGALILPQSAQTPVRAGGEIAHPRLVSSAQPRYTDAARKAKIEGVVELDVVVLADGNVGDVSVAKSLDKVHGLDEAAIAAAKQWKFRPSLDRSGNPIPVVVTLKLEFKVRSADGLPSVALRAPVVSEVPAEFRQDARVFGALGVQSPMLTASVDPKYTSAAMLAKIQGTVDVDVVIGPDGRVARARVARSLDAVHGLDEMALAAAKQWMFSPGLEGGQPVPVLARITLNFRLH